MNRIEFYYDSGRRPETYAPDDINMSLLPNLDGGNGPLGLSVIQRYRYCTKLFADMRAADLKVRNQAEISYVAVSPEYPELTTAKADKFPEYSFLSESFVFQMRRTIDTLVQLADCIEIGPTERKPVGLNTPSITNLLKSGGANNPIYAVIM